MTWIRRRRRTGMILFQCEGLINIEGLKGLATPAICKTGDGPPGDFLLLGDAVNFILLGDNFTRVRLAS